jgi:hypothetical protein
LPALFIAALLTLANVVSAHDGHDHDAPVPLNLPVAPRVVAVTPDYELVGVLSGEHRLTIFLHRFATNEPVRNARLSLSAGEHEVEAVPRDDGVFEASAPWIGAAVDIVFKLTLPDDQDIFTGRLEKAAARTAAIGIGPAPFVERHATLLVGVAALMGGVLLTLLIGARLVGPRGVRSRQQPADQGSDKPKVDAELKVKRLRRVPIAVLGIFLATTS